MKIFSSRQSTTLSSSNTQSLHPVGKKWICTTFLLCMTQSSRIFITSPRDSSCASSTFYPHTLFWNFSTSSDQEGELPHLYIHCFSREGADVDVHVHLHTHKCIA